MAETKKTLFASGHRACPGCGVPVAVRSILNATGPNVVVVTSTGCLETFSSPINLSSWEVPWIHSVFENAPSVATGVLEALNAKGNPDNTKVVAICGDGATNDIGFGALSGMLERDDDVLYICYDNEAYMNTGVQASSSTPYGATTTTSPSGECSFGRDRRKKNMTEIALAHGVKYVATASISDLKDLERKVKKGLETKGAAYIQVLATCNIGWGFDSSLAIELAKLAVQTGVFPVYEYENGELTNVKKLKTKKPVEEYLSCQKRFKHLFADKEKNKEQLDYIEQITLNNVEKYGLLASKQ